jgi:hypothetical protein
LTAVVYDPARLDLDHALDGADLVLVHEWNGPALVAHIGAHRRSSRHYLLLFHDPHHRMVSAPNEMAEFDLDGFNGVLAFGELLREAYARRGWGRARTPGTRQPICGGSTPTPSCRGAAIWCRSAIGATRSGRRNWGSS